MHAPANQHLNVVSVNCRGKCGKVSGMKTMVAGITEKFPLWDCVILQEIDTHKSSDGPDICDVADAMQPLLLMRSYGGQG